MEKDLALVEVAGLYFFYYRSDDAFTHAMTDPRAREVRVEDVNVSWRTGEVDPDRAWDLKGMGCFSLVSIHYWRHGIDFDYLDIGANVGLTTVIQAVFYKRCGRPNKVYAFEPGEVFGLLDRAVQINQISDMTTCIRAAAADVAGKIEFHLTPAQSPASSLLKTAVVRPNVVETRATIVEAVRLDDFVKSLRPAAGLLLKIDAEGADFKVLDGMAHTLRERICCFQIEFFPALIQSYTNPVDRLRELGERFEMIDLGTSPYTLIENSTRSVKQLVARTEQRPIPTTDVFLVPKRLPAATALIDRLLAD
jgi:FkbM family methyltransferase